jgi:eukaryotic-like serine/threonine-protein kinase
MSDTVLLPSSPVLGQRPGDVIAGKYRLERELGRGAMGTVWSAMHATLGQRVAIKLIAGDQSRSPEARQRFSIEAKAAARLRSRHVVQVYDDGETPDGTPYIVMEYLEGQTLEERLDGQQDLGLGEAVRITTHVGRALARAHAQAVVHRDLKSGNIFIAKSEDDELGWVAKVLDFGVAKVLNEVAGPSATKTGTIVGTPLFMSPEQIRGAASVDHRADLYSLGMVFYNMVTGSHAFDGPSYSDVLVAICTEALPDIRMAAPWLPPALRVWFEKACARERDDRFQSADEMVEALQEAAGPGARLSRPSVPEEVGGPSGTLVGHVPPHSARTILAGDFGEHPRAAPHALRAPQVDAPSAPRQGNAPRTDSRGPATSHAMHASLWLWGASGAGLAVATVALALVIGRTTSRSEGSPKTESTATRTIVAAPSSPPVPAGRATPAPAPTTADVAANSPPANAPETLTTTPAVSTATSPTRPSVPADTHGASARRMSATQRHAPGATAAASPPPVAIPRPAAASAAPDMGF